MKKKPTAESQPEQPNNAVENTKPESSTEKKDFLVVGLGASAGGVKALQEFFAAMPPNSGMAFVAILHLSPEHESNLAQILQARTTMKVIQVTETVKVEPNNVYVIPPNRQLEMVDGVIRPAEAIRPAGERIAIDVFFRTLAEAYEKNSVCVVMSGTGSDGTLGLKRVKESNGFAIVQDPEDAEYDAMPRSAINTQLADWVLPINRMPEKLIHFRESSERLHLTNGADAKRIAEEIHADESLREILTILRVRTGHDFSNYKTPTLIRRLARHLQIHELTDIPSYLELLRNNPDEIQSLLKNLLINVTNFFRDKSAFEALETQVIPNLFAGKTGRDTVRVWSCGCASGEEAYSLAMILQEFADTLADPPKIQIFASDVDDEAIQEAREHRYPESIEADISGERLKRFFVKEGSFYRVKKELRETVLFAPHNVLRDPPFSRLDLIACRNLLIYLNRETQEKVLQIFHFALNSSGYLFLGSSETAESVATLYAPLDKKNRLYSRRTAPLPPNALPMMPVAGRWEVRLPERKTDAVRHRAAFLSDIHYKLLENHVPSSVLVNQDFDIVYSSGAAEKFLRFASGEPSRNLLKAINPELLPDLRAALFTAQREHQSSEFPNIRLNLNGAVTMINLIVRAVDVKDDARDFLLVIFEEKNSPAVIREADRELEKITNKDEARETVLRRLEEDLQRTKEHLRFTIEQHETTVEELKAANEELQAINEELRSASEELETSKEELQSVNEELTTVNHELKDKVDETGRINSDLSNLMAATDIATIFLDRNLGIKRYTPPVEDFFNLANTDIGRPLTHFTHKLNYDDLAKDAARVLKNLTAIEREITDRDGRAFIARFAPYRTLDDRIDGVVLNFIDITERKCAEDTAAADLRDTQILHGLSTRLVTAENIQIVYDEIMTAAIRLTNSDAGTVQIYDPHMEELMLLATSGFSRKMIDHFALVNAGSKTSCGIALGKGERTFVDFDDPQAEDTDGSLRMHLEAGYRSAQSTPLVSRTGKPIGMVSTHWKTPGHRPTESELRFLDLLARQAADLIEQRQAEEKLRRAAELDAFRVKLNDALRPLEEPFAVQREACRLLRLRLGAMRVAWGEMRPDGATCTVMGEDMAENVSSLEGRDWDWNEFDPAGLKALKKSQTIYREDVQAASDLSAEQKATFAALNFQAFINVPLVKSGRLVAFLLVHFEEPRQFTPLEIALTEEIAERTWAAFERARAEDALRKSEERQAFLLKLSDALRLISDSKEIQRVAMRLAGEHLGADRVAYADISADGETYLMSDNYVTEGFTKMTGTFPVSSFGSASVKLRAGETVIINNVELETELTEAEKENFYAINVYAGLAIPLIKNGHLVAVFGCHQGKPRDWKDEEVTLLYETAERIWAAIERTRAEEALRESEAKYRSLFDSIDEGFCLIETIFDDAGKAVDFRYLETNPVYESQTGMKMVGKLASEIVPDTEDIWFESLGEVARTGNAWRFENYHEPTGRWYAGFASRVGGEGSRLLTLVFDDVTERKRREGKLAFLAEVAADLSRLTAPDEIMQSVGAHLGEFLHVATCIFADVDEAKNEAVIHHGWNSEDVPSLKQTFRLADYFGEEFRRAGRAGETIAVSDTETDERADAEAYAKLKLGAFVTVPFQRQGRWTANITVTTREPRDWRADEIELLQEIASRVFPRIERARAEQAVQESEAKYRTLFNSIDEGFALIEFLPDSESRSPDFRFVEVNESFERQTDNQDVTGKLGSEINPEADTVWIETFGEVARTGAPVRLEIHHQKTGRWYDVFATRVGDTEYRQVCVIFQDITERKHRERNLAFLADIENRFASLTSSEEITRVATASIGAHFNISHCILVDINEQMTVASVFYDHRTPAELPSFVGDYVLGNFHSAAEIEQLAAGQPVVINDVFSERQPPESGENFDEIGTRSLVTAPYVRDGRWKFALGVQNTEPREWREDETKFLTELATRVALRIERARAEEALRESEELFRLVSDAVPSVLYDWDVPKDIISRSPELENLLGFSANDVKTQTNKWWKTRLHPDDVKDAIAKVVEKLKSDEYRFEDEYRLKHLNGHYVWVRDTGILLRDETGKVTRWVGSATDITQRKESEEHFRAIVDQNIAGIFEIDLSGKIIFANDELCRMLGYDCGTLAEMRLEKYIHSEDLPESLKKLKQMRKDKTPFEIEKRYLKKDGSLIWVHNSISPLTNGDDKIQSAVIVSLDITMRKNAENALRESEERLRIAVEAAAMATWDWNLETDEVIWNERHFTLFGMKPVKQPVRPEDFSSRVHPDDREWVVERLNQAVATKTTFTAEFRIFREDDGRLRWMEGYGHSVEEAADGAASRMSGVMSDITNRKRAEEAVRASEERLQLILKSITDYAVITSDPHGIINGWNTGAENAFGWTAQEAVGQSCALIFTPEDRAARIPEQEMRTAYETGVADDVRWHVRRDGSRFFASGTVSPIRNGEFDGFVKITSDQTARMAAETALREKETLQKLVKAQEDERKRIARDLHDELGQQLTALRIRLDAVSEKQTEPVLRNQLYEIQDIARSIDDGVDFLAFELRPTTLDDLGLAAALDKYVKQWSHYAGVRAELTISELKRVRFTSEVETCLYRIVQEALNNTHKHAKATNADVVLEKRGDLLVLIIEDNGRGFDQTSKKNRAKGIGLIGMKERAELVGGAFEIETAPKQGTTIYVRIPFAAATEK